MQAFVARIRGAERLLSRESAVKNTEVRQQAELSPAGSRTDLRASRGKKYRVLVVATHAVQYGSPVFRVMAQHPDLDPLVAYCSLQGAEPGMDPEFGVEVSWDVPLLEGYPWVHVPNRSPHPAIGRFFGLVNPGLWRLVQKGGFDAVVLLTGYMYASFWLAVWAAKRQGVALLVAADSTTLVPRDAKPWKAWVKPWLVPRILRMADIVMVGSSAGRQLMRGLGIDEERIVLTPFVVDNDWWRSQAESVDRQAVRAVLGIPPQAPIVLFCAKLQPWKRPFDVLRAFARANVPGAYLVFAGEGPLRRQLQEEAAALGVVNRVKLLGFVNQSQLPAIYCAADLLVLPSQHDPCPVVVCESMLCGTPVVLSDEIRGRFDLVEHGRTGFIYRWGDVDALARVLAMTLPDRLRLQEMSAAAQKCMQTWSPRENVAAVAVAVAKAVSRRDARAKP